MHKTGCDDACMITGKREGMSSRDGTSMEVSEFERVEFRAAPEGGWKFGRGGSNAQVRSTSAEIKMQVD